MASARTLFWSLLAAVLFVQPAHARDTLRSKMASSSMLPCLKKGDMLIASFGVPEGELEQLRGKVALYMGSGGLSVHRIVGLPGDRVSVAGGRLTLNGTAVPLTRPEGFAKLDSSEGHGEAHLEAVSKEIAYPIFLRPSAAFNDFPEAVVPDESVFLLGDNRGGALDSRAPQVGFVPVARIEGLIGVIYNDVNSSDVCKVESRGYRFPWE